LLARKIADGTAALYLLRDAQVNILKSAILWMDSWWKIIAK